VAEGEVSAEATPGANGFGRPGYQDVETAAAGHILGEARLTGTYQR
jgi:hypothetical protein